MSTFGSGELGDYSGGTPSISTDQTIANADVWMFGDSIARQTQRDLAVQLLEKRGQTIAVFTQGGLPAAPCVDALALWLQRFDPPKQIIMECGTNDIFNPPVLKAQINRVMDLVDCRSEVYWKDVQVCRTAQPVDVQIADQRNTGWVNQQIHEAVGCYDNLTLIPWFASLARKVGLHAYYLRDGVHPKDDPGIPYHNAVVLGAVPFEP